MEKPAQDKILWKVIPNIYIISLMHILGCNQKRAYEIFFDYFVMHKVSVKHRESNITGVKKAFENLKQCKFSKFYQN